METMKGSCHCGAIRWEFDGRPDDATACNCTVCRRYGVLWAYDWEGERIRTAGTTHAYMRGKAIEFHFCPNCGCVTFWRGHHPSSDGRRRIAVNLRLAEPDAVADIPVRHFDGFGKFEDLPDDGRCVGDYWF
ncbi:MAG TPA: GFA family protein [Ramlibacter sp.]